MWTGTRPGKISRSGGRKVKLVLGINRFISYKAVEWHQETKQDKGDDGAAWGVGEEEFDELC